jgi:predicted SnoaL-like aldol condensation-catalyzing enzyme
MTSIDIWRVQDGRLIEHWDEINSFELLAQLGAVATPQMAS